MGVHKISILCAISVVILAAAISVSANGDDPEARDSSADDTEDVNEAKAWGWQWQRRTICENSISLFKCKQSLVLQIVLAQYYRASPSICPHPRGQKRCSGRSVLPWVARCNGQQSCSIGANNAAFPNPCPDINKYLHVMYRCTSPQSLQQKTKRVFKPAAATRHIPRFLLLSRFRPTSQSSTIILKESNRAVDGNAQTCALTWPQRDPWWRVDLERRRTIRLVRISQRHGGSGLFNLVVEVSDNDMDYRQCADKRAATEHVLTVVCQSMARFVRLRLRQDIAALKLCEVEVFGYF